MDGGGKRAAVANADGDIRIIAQQVAQVLRSGEAQRAQRQSLFGKVRGDAAKIQAEARAEARLQLHAGNNIAIDGDFYCPFRHGAGNQAVGFHGGQAKTFGDGGLGQAAYVVEPGGTQAERLLAVGNERFFHALIFWHLQAMDLHHRPGSLLAFFHEVIGIETNVLCRRLEVVRRQRNGVHRYLSGKLGLHQTADHRLGNKIMAVDAAVNHQRGADDGIIAATFCQTLGQQGHLKRTGHVQALHIAADVLALHFLLKTDQRLRHDIAVPVGFNKGDL